MRTMPTENVQKKGNCMARPRSDHTMHQGKRRPAPLLPTQQIEKVVLK